MQERIIEIIVYLLSNLNQERKGKGKFDLTNELLVKGYTDVEINLAFSWLFNHLKKPVTDRLNQAGQYAEDLEDYPEFDELVISPDAYGYFLQLVQLGVIKEDDIEMFIERAVAFGKDDISVDDLKSIVASILFGLDNRSSFNGYPSYQGDMIFQ